MSPHARLHPAARRGLALGVAVGALALAAAPAGAAGTSASGARFQLTPAGPGAGGTKALGRLRAALPHASVGQVLADGNRRASPLPTGAPQRGADGFQNGFRFNAGDTGTDDWFPQGITGSGDASPDGLVDGRRSLLVSWYARQADGVGTRKPGVRVSFVGAEDLGRATYRHVLLVDPYTRKDGTGDFRWTDSHAGGIAWVGNRLYVAETNDGLSVYDTSKMMRVTTGNKAKVGCTPNPCEAADYRYVMPKVASYGRRTGGLVFSSVAYDRATNSLVTGEYRKGKGGARIVRWQLAANGALRTQRTKAGRRVVSDGTWTTDATNVQGVLTRGSTVWLSTSGDAHGLYQGTLGGGLRKRGWPSGGEDLTYAPASGRIYSLTEQEGSRGVFAVGG